MKESPSTASFSGWGRVAILAAVFLAGFNMRAALVAVMPLLEIVRDDTGLTRGIAGLLTTLPVLLMGVLAPIGARVTTGSRTEIGIASAMILIGASTMARLWDSLPVLFSTAALLGLGMAIGQPLIMGFAKAQFAKQVALVAGVYAAGINVGAAAAARSSLPVFEFTGAWQMPLAMWAVPALLTALIWIALPTRTKPQPRALRNPTIWGSLLSWLLAGFFSITVFVYYSVLTWLSPIFIDAGWTGEDAAAILSLFALAQLPGTLVFPWLAGRRGSYGPWLVITIVLSSGGLVMAALSPNVAPWLIAGMLGIGTGGLFPLCLALPVANAPDSRTATRLSAMAFALGYGTGAFGPYVIGALRDRTGGYAMPMTMLALLGIVQLVLIPHIVPRKDGAPAWRDSDGAAKPSTC